jgi:hypothetical protein
MVQLIGVMIGFYVITRMIDLMIARNGQWFVQVCAIITALVTLLCLIGLMMTGVTGG